MAWTWVASANRYRESETGQWLTFDRAREFVNSSLAASGNVVTALATFAGSDPPTIAPDDFRAAMRQEIKDEYIRQYLLGRGGREQMTQADWGSIGGMLAEQYSYLEGFVAEVGTGELSEAAIAARAKMYINSAREGFERANRRVQENAGYTEMLWNLNPAEHCEDCISLNALGWVEIGSDAFGGCYPGSGCTICLTNCACNIEYR